MVTPHFRGIFGQAIKIFGGTEENLLKHIFYFIEPMEFQIAYQSKCHIF